MLISFVFYLTLGMVHSDNILIFDVSQVVLPLIISSLIIKVVDVREQFENIEEFELREDMLQWICIEATKLGFGVVIGSSDNGTDRRNTFVILTCERSGKYIRRIQNLKHDDTGSRICECPFRLCGYLMANKK